MGETQPGVESLVSTLRRALVTGASGFIGAALCRRLLRDGVEVIGVSRRPVEALPRARRVDGCYLVRGDVTDLPLMARTLAEYEPDAVFHLAGDAPGVSPGEPLHAFENRTRAAWIVLDAVRRTRCARRVVLLSTIDAYQAQQPIRGAPPDAAANACADLIARSYVDSYHLPVAVARTQLVFGPGDLRWDRLVPGTLRSTLRRQAPPAARNDSVRPIFLDDAVEGLVELARNLQPGQVVDLLGPDAVAADELQRRLGQLAAQSLPHTHGDGALGKAFGQTVDWYRDYLASTVAS